MTPFSVVVSHSARRELKRLPASVVQRVAVLVRVLREQPRPQGCLKLKGLEATYRIRIGNYRLVYEIDDVGRVVLISRVRHRGEAYE